MHKILQHAVFIPTQTSHPLAIYPYTKHYITQPQARKYTCTHTYVIMYRMRPNKHIRLFQINLLLYNVMIVWFIS